jgi:hypothetical protein
MGATAFIDRKAKEFSCWTTHNHNGSWMYVEAESAANIVDWDSGGNLRGREPGLEVLPWKYVA